jgi:drug/metabolite transporter (DMT)-like permease
MTELPALRGGMLALGAALLFGASTPLLQKFGAGIGGFWSAALLYAGAAVAGGSSWRPVTREARLRRVDLPRLAAMAACGAALGPVLLVWGLAHASGAGASLMLSLEAVFTALFARALYLEQIDRRVAAAMCLLTAGGAALIADHGMAGDIGLPGLLAVLGATAAWGLDNTLSRGVALRDPGQVVLVKSLLGVLATSLLALTFGQPFPPMAGALTLLVIGAVGYGFSLRLYLLAQREFGAARTGSVFAFAPFIGAGIAFALEPRAVSLWLGAGAVLMLAGVLLHLAERHAHEHRHALLEHEHAHAHDDGHHAHFHEGGAAGTHSHAHRHEAMTHTHPHVPDAHHLHRH